MPNSAGVSLEQICSEECCDMAKFRVREERITITLGRSLRQEIAQWAVSERRTVSNLVRGLLSDLVDERMTTRGTAASRPIQRQLTA
jgi:CopG-like RHH_1 or ribbon-helix-helix domain, RHH_5